MLLLSAAHLYVDVTACCLAHVVDANVGGEILSKKDISKNK